MRVTNDVEWWTVPVLFKRGSVNSLLVVGWFGNDEDQ